MVTLLYIPCLIAGAACKFSLDYSDEVVAWSSIEPMECAYSGFL